MHFPPETVYILPEMHIVLGPKTIFNFKCEFEYQFNYRFTKN